MACVDQARAPDTDKDAREVTLADIKFDSANFRQCAGSRALSISRWHRKISPGTRSSGQSLDHLEASLAAAQVAGESGIVPVKQYTRPDILFSFEPAVLDSIDGEAV